MKINPTKLNFESVDNLYLDPLNPRVGRHNIGEDVSQDVILDLVSDWSLDELARSYLGNGGFWTHEALLVVREHLYGELRLVVVEGNRRLAALKFLQNACNGTPYNRRWKEIAEENTVPDELFSDVPYILVSSRDDVQAYLGFRHVTGIKPWDADEKAYFIAKLIDDQNMTYEEVMRQIGSTTPAVRRHYLAYRTLLQIEQFANSLDTDRIEQSFTILYMSLDTVGARSFLQIDIMADPRVVKNPVPQTHLDNLAEFAKWLYGTNDGINPLITNTGQVAKFGKVLASEDAIGYLRRTRKPQLETAYEYAGGDEEEIIELIQQAADCIEDALGKVHHHKESIDLQENVRRVGADTFELLARFPDVLTELIEEYSLC